MITKEQIQDLSKKLNIDWYSILREYIQIVFLSTLYNEKDSQEVFFKGGTSLRLLLNSFRFSEDLDFTTKLDIKENEKLVNIAVEKANLTIPNLTFKKSKSIAQSYCGSIKYQSDEYKYPLSIHVEFSHGEKPITKKESLLDTPFPVSPYPIIVHMSWEEILAEKIRALMTRAKGRDLFDIYYLLSKGIKIDMKLVNKKLELINKEGSIDEIIKKIKSFNNENLVNDLNKYLPTTHRKITSSLQEMVLEKLK